MTENKYTEMFQVGGGIIEQLSSTIPSNIFALNELIKNSYDAGSSQVDITVNENKSLIIVSDDGQGISGKNIKELVHIARSTKKYAEKRICSIAGNKVDRYVQGSKGLGVLSAFKFGNKVEWSSVHKGIRRTFSANKNALIRRKEISGSEINITAIDTNEEPGTRITIYSDPNIITELIEYFQDERNIQKLVGAFTRKTRENFSIKLNSTRSKFSTKNLKVPQDILPERQLYHVKYYSDDGALKIYHKSSKVPVINKPYQLSRDDYSIRMDLVVFHLKTNSGKKIPGYYKKENNTVTPLVFINDNLFNNTSLFDPDAFRKIRSKIALPQIIGDIAIESSSEGLVFNSDRTNLSETPFSSALENDLFKLNEIIQTEGSEFKQSFPGNIEKELGRPLSGDEDSGNDIQNAIMFIKQDLPVQYEIPSQQIKLKEYISKIKNSSGEDVNLSDVDVLVDGELLSTGILPSIDEPSTIQVLFKYEDANTGVLIKDVELIFKEKKGSIISGKDDDATGWFSITGCDDYKISHCGRAVNSLIQSIQDANPHTRSGKKYYPLISCSLRSLYELPNDILKKKMPNKLFPISAKNSGDLTTNVLEVILLVKKNNKLIELLSKSTGMNYTTWRNELLPSRFKEAISKAHVSAHKSLSSTTVNDLEFMAKYAAKFIVLCDVLLSSKTEVVQLLNEKQLSLVDKEGVEQITKN